MLRTSSFVSLKRMAAALMTITSQLAGSSRTPLIILTSAWMKAVTSAYVTCSLAGCPPLGLGTWVGEGGLPGSVYKQSEVRPPAAQAGRGRGGGQSL